MANPSNLFEIHSHLALHTFERRNAAILIDRGSVICADFNVCKSCGHMFTINNIDFVNLKMLYHLAFLKGAVEACADITLDPMYKAKIVEDHPE